MSNDDAQRGIQAAAQTITSVMTDLTSIGMHWRDSMTADKAEATACILDRLAGELAEAAGFLRGRTPDGGWVSGSMAP